MDYNPLYDRLWGADGVHPFGDPFKFENYMSEERYDIVYENLEEETYEYLRGDYKTTIVCKFNSKGYLVSHTTECVDISEDRAIMEYIRNELFKALEEERYEDAKICQEKINKLRHVFDKTKPSY